MRSRVGAIAEFERAHAEGLGDLKEFQDRDGPDTALKAMRVRPADARFGGQAFLIPTLRLAELSNAGAGLFEVWVRARARRHSPNRGRNQRSSSLDQGLHVRPYHTKPAVAGT